MKIVIRATVAVLVLILLFVTVLARKENPAAADDNPCITGGAIASGPVRAPLTGSFTATSPFGMRVNPGGVLKGRFMLHPGVDLVSPNKVVVAAMGGRVKSTPVNNIGGYHVYVDVGGGVQMYYAHLVAGSVKVKVGDPVWAGRPLGTEGATGNVTGVHLHFGIMVNGKPTDPVPWMASKGVRLPAINGSSTGAPAVVSAPSTTTGTATASTSVTSTPPVSTDMAFALPPPIEANRKDSKVNPPLSIPVEAQNAYKSAARRYGIPWTLLAGIGMDETGHGRNKNTSSAGAQGPMQFMPATWAQMGVDGDGDGVKDILDIEDAAHGAANYLVRSGAKEGPAGVMRAIRVYNHADWYVADVLYYAMKYGGGTVIGGGNGCDTTGVNDTKGKLPPVPKVGEGSPARIVQAARAWIGTPYSWGGGTLDGPGLGIRTSTRLDGTTTVGFDCSHFIAMAVWHGMGVKVPAGSNAQANWRGDKDVKATPVAADLASMQPGDLVAVSRAGGATGTFNHIGIYVGDNQWIDAPKPGTTIQVRSLKGYGGTWKVLRLTN